jgi:uncharacterized protein YqgC (DUF456 family)
MSAIALIILAVIFMAPGIAGVFLPILPSIPYMWLVALIYGFATSFSLLSLNELGILTAITLLSILVDFLSGFLGAKFSGASAKALTWGIIGFILGFLLLPPLGGFLGMFAGVLAGELYLGALQDRALRAATGSLIGTVAGMVINLILALVFIGLFLYFVL